MAITLQRAREMFDLVNAKLCCPGNPAALCITFLYPDDGCWGRAHEMCRLMIAAGEQPRKIWISCGRQREVHWDPQLAYSNVVSFVAGNRNQLAQVSLERIAQPG